MTDSLQSSTVPAIVVSATDHDLLIRVDTKLDIFIKRLDDMDNRLRAVEHAVSPEDAKRWKVVADEWADFKVERKVEQQNRAKFWAIFTTVSGLISSAVLAMLHYAGVWK